MILGYNLMCQCILCDCCWWNCCGEFCAGWHVAYCLCSAWCFKPKNMLEYDSMCYHFMSFDGWGSNCFCCGSVWFVSESIKEWSDMRNRTRAANDAYVVIDNEKPAEESRTS